MNESWGTKCKQERSEKGYLRAWDRGENREKIKNRKVSTEDLGEVKSWKNGADSIWNGAE